MIRLKTVACLPFQKFRNDPPPHPLRTRAHTHTHFDGPIALALRRLCAALGFLKVEATDLNKHPSIMNVTLKLRNLAGSRLPKLRRLLVGEPEWGGRMTGNGRLFLRCLPPSTGGR